MINIKDSICIAGSKDGINEDFIAYGTDFMFVIDGASGLSGINIMAKSDVAWFATEVGNRLKKALEENNEAITEEILNKIILELKTAYEFEAKRQNIKIPLDGVSAGLSLFRIRNGVLEYFGLGDCIGIIEKDNACIILEDELLPQLDKNVLTKMIELHREIGVDIVDCRELCKDMLLENRSKRNTENGYWVLDLSGDGIYNARKNIFELSDINNIYAFTDGFIQLVEVFNKYNYKELCTEIKEKSLFDLYNKLYDLQEKDSKCNDFPRFKLRDDTSGIYGIIEK